MELVNFYQVMNNKGDIDWGGSSATEAVKWFRRSINNSIFVSVWDESDGENPVLVTDRIEVTGLFLSLLASEREDRYPVKDKKEWVMK